MSNGLYQRLVRFARSTLIRANLLNDELKAIEESFAKLPSPADQFGGRTVFAEDTGTANAYAVTVQGGPATPTAGTHAVFSANATNTGASTLRYGGWDAKPIKRKDGSDLAAGDITAGSIIELRYDGSAWIVGGLTTKQLNEVRDYVDVTASSGNLAEVASVSNEIAIVGALSTEVQAVAGIAADVEQVGQSIADVSAVAANMSAVRNASDVVTGLSAAAIPVTPVGSLTAADVQSALAELNSAAPYLPLQNMQVFTTSDTFAKPQHVDRVFVTIINAGNQGSGGTAALSGRGGSGGNAAQAFMDLTGDAIVVVGAYPGGQSSFDGKTVAGAGGFQLGGARGGTGGNSGGLVGYAYGGISGFGGTYGRGGDAIPGPNYTAGTNGAVIVMW